MRILQVAPSAQRAGGEEVVLQLARGLAARGQEVEVAVPAPGPLAEAVAGLGLKLHLLPVARTYDLGAALRLGRLARDRAIDLVHTHGMLVNVPGRLAALGPGAPPTVATVHLTQGLTGPVRVGGRWEGLKARLYYRPLDTLTARANAAVVAVSAAVRDDLVVQGYPAGRIRVIRNGIDPAGLAVPADTRDRTRAALGLGPADRMLLVLARLSPQKDLPTFLAALALARREQPGLVTRIAGSGPLGDALRAQAAGLGLGPACAWLGQRDDVPALLAAADALVLSSRWEGLPISVLEAMAAGLPVVATRVDGTAEAVVDGATGWLVPPGDPAALAEALRALARDPDEAARRGRAGRARVEAEFSVEATVGAHLALYRECVGGGGAPPPSPRDRESRS